MTAQAIKDLICRVSRDADHPAKAKDDDRFTQVRREDKDRQ